jgi:quinohemoprotein ethanol dehydrogenase
MGLAWSMDLPETGSLYTSPVVVDGVLYFAQGYSVLHAVDARAGKLLWKYDPEVWKVAGVKQRAAWGSRGIAWYDGKIYAGTIDGRLIAVNAKTGKLAWEIQTTEGPEDGRYITGAPWVFKGKVLIGHGGSDFNPVRGYVTAYDAATGKQAWRFFIVPGDPKKGFENKAMEMAAKSWTGEWWKFGGGGAAWNAMAYDPKYNRVYIGTGNGSPWNAKVRSPGGGDNLFLGSVVALDADTGDYVWHYQENPGETWDYNSAMDIELATLSIDGKPRDVLMHAPKNGFFYVIDRATGKPISAEKYVKVNWASKIDLKTGRPIENPAARYNDPKGFVQMPGPMGGHNAQPMSFSPTSGLSYIPAQDTANFYTDAGVDRKNWKPVLGRMGYNTAITFAKPPSPLPKRDTFLLAWDPVKQKEAWRAPLPMTTGGGVISTGSNLVFAGTSAGKFVAYHGSTGKTLWSFDAQTGISSEPITYTVDGKQYVTVLAGYRGIIDESPWDYRTQKRRVLTFILGGKATLPPPVPRAKKQFANDPAFIVDDAKAAQGEKLYSASRCTSCHGAALNAGGMAPDLRESGVPLSPETFTQVINEGILRQQGMPGFPELKPEELEALRHYIVRTARAAAKGTDTGPHDEELRH